MLQLSSMKTEKEIGQSLKSVLLCSIGSNDTSCIHTIIENSSIARQERESMQSGLWQQLQDLKAMLQGIVKSRDAAPSSSSNPESSMSSRE